MGAYVTYQLNLWGPMLKMANAASAQALEEGKKRLREFLETSEGGRQALAMSSGSDGYEMGSVSRRRTGKRDAKGSDDEGEDGDL